MTPEEHNEIFKCHQSPYYFATKYLIVNGKPFTTPLTEEQFNFIFKERDKMIKTNKGLEPLKRSLR